MLDEMLSATNSTEAVSHTESADEVYDSDDEVIITPATNDCQLVNHTRGRSPLCMYDLTIPDGYFTLDQILAFFRTHAKRWAFQKERGDDTGYIHYQCRLSLRTKKRVETMVTFINTHLKGAHVSPTSNPTFYAGDDFYVLKEDTRILGPWTSKDDFDESRIPRRFRGTPVWRPFQQSLCDIIKTPPDDRTVNNIISPHGAEGKSFVVGYLTVRGLADRIPVQKDARDISRMVMNKPIRSCYFIDIPRAANNVSKHAIYGAIEELKNGYVFDDRYHFKDKWIEPPHVWVFSNTQPEAFLLSSDRWRFWTINDRHELVPFVAPNLTSVTSLGSTGQYPDADAAAYDPRFRSHSLTNGVSATETVVVPRRFLTLNVLPIKDEKCATEVSVTHSH